VAIVIGVAVTVGWGVKVGPSVLVAVKVPDMGLLFGFVRLPVTFPEIEVFPAETVPVKL